MIQRLGTKVRVGAAGLSIDRDQVSGRKINIGGQVAAADTGTVQTRLSGLLAALSNGEQNLRIYDDREIPCTLSGGFRTSIVNGSAGTVYTWKAQLTSRFPWWFGVSPTTDVFTPSGAGPSTFVTSNPASNVEVFPTIKLTNLATTFTDKVITLENVSTTKQVQLVGISLGQNDFVFFDMLEAFLGDGASTPTHPFNVNGVFWSMVAAAPTTIKITHNIGSGASWRFDIVFTPQFWSV